MSRAKPLTAALGWETVELLGYSHFSGLGHRILVPLVKPVGYDFVAEKDGRFVRVNVKLAGLKNKRRPNGWSISVSSGAGQKSGLHEVDIYLVYLPAEQRFIELPGEFFAGSKSKSKLIPTDPQR